MRGLTGQISGVLEDKLVGFIQSGLSGVQSYFFSIYATNPLVALAQTKHLHCWHLNQFKNYLVPLVV